MLGLRMQGVLGISEEPRVAAKFLVPSFRIHRCAWDFGGRRVDTELLVPFRRCGWNFGAKRVVTKVLVPFSRIRRCATFSMEIVFDMCGGSRVVTSV